MKIAFIGQKGIPALFGGVEFHVDALSRQLARRGHHVTTYVRSWYTPRDLMIYDGVHLLHTPTIRTKHLDAFLHSFTASLHALVQDYDIIHYHGLGPSFFGWLPRLGGQTVVVTIHALDWQRPKWRRGAKAFLKMTERSAIYLPHSTIVVSGSLERYFQSKYGKPVHYIPNGVGVPPLAPPRLIAEAYGLKGQDYILFLGRLVPEKRVDWLIRAFRRTPDSLRLVIAGGEDNVDAPGRYLHELQALVGGDPRVLFTGTIGGQVKEELLSNARYYITPSSMEGLPLALLEAMAHSRCCLASNIPSHQEIVEAGRDGLLFDCNDFEQFADVLKDLLAQSDGSRAALGEAARCKVSEKYSWENVTEATERLYDSLLTHHPLSHQRREREASLQRTEVRRP